MVVGMKNDNTLTSATNDYCFAEPGVSYVVFLPSGGSTNIQLAAGEYSVDWFNPRTGGALRKGSVQTLTGGGSVSIGNPPSDAAKDWAVLIHDGNGTPVVNAPPTLALSTPNGATYDAPATIMLASNAADSDGTIFRVDFYNGTTKIGSSVISPYTYTWSNVAAGSYTLTAKAIDNDGDTTTSSPLKVTVGASGVLQNSVSEMRGLSLDYGENGFTASLLPAQGFELTVFDIHGRAIWRFNDRNDKVGMRQISWKTHQHHGVFLAVLKQGHSTVATKINVIR